MKTPTNIGGNNLITFYQTATEMRRADLYTITLKSGLVLRYTDYESDLTVLGVTFLSGSPNLKRSGVEENIGMGISTLDLTVNAKITDTINGVPILQLFMLGTFDGAAVLLERLIMDRTGVQIGKFIRFGGEMGKVDEIGRVYAKVSVQSNVSKLAVQIPRKIIQTGCNNTLFDAGCGLNVALFTHTTTVQAGSTRNKLVTGLVEADGYYDLGRIVYTAGVNVGLVKAIKSYVAGVLYFNSPLPFDPSAGDTIQAIAGCDKLMATCSSPKFNNLVNFEGFPFVPKPETAL